MDNMHGFEFDNDDEFYTISPEERSILSKLNISLVILCPHKPIHKLMLISKGFFRQLGYTQEEFWDLYLSNPGFLLHPEDVAKLHLITNYGIAHEQVEMTEVLRIKAASGKYLFIQGTALLHKDQQGREAFYITCSDITETYTYEMASKHSVLQTCQIHHTILNMSTSAIFWKDTHGRFLGANRTFLNFIDLELEELVGHTAEELNLIMPFCPELIPDREVLAGKKILNISGKLLYKRAIYRDVIFSKTPLYYEDKIIGVIGTIDDIPLLQRESDLTIKKLRTALYNIPTGLCVYQVVEGNKLQLTFMNPIAMETFNITALDITSKNAIHGEDNILFSMIHPEDRGYIRYNEENFLSKNRLDSVVCRIKPKNKAEYIYLRMIAHYFQNDNNDKFIYLNFVDITSEKKMEHDLLETQLAYTTVSASAGLLIWIYDLNSSTMELVDNEISRYMHKKYGIPKIIYDAPESFAKYIDPISLNDYYQLHRDLKNGQSGQCDILLKNYKNEPPHWERIIYSLYKDVQTNSFKAYGIGYNITKEKLQRLQYKKELTLLHTITRNNLIANIHVNLNTDAILDRMLHSPHSADLQLDGSYTDFVHSLLQLIPNYKDRTKLASLLDSNNLLQKFALGERNFNIEYKRNCPDLSPIMVDCALNTFKNDQGEIELFIYLYDITNKFINQIIASKLFEIGYIHVALVNTTTGTMTYYSKRTGILESTPQAPLYYDMEVSKQLEYYLDTQAEITKIKELLALGNLLKILEKEPLLDLSCDLSIDGKVRRIRTQGCYMDKSHTNLFIIQSDITPQYYLEEKRTKELEHALTLAEHANESRSLFLSSISHDMRTPLNAILSFTNFALKTEKMSEQKDFLEKISQSGELLLSLINDTLNLTRLESGKVSIQYEVLHLPELIDNILTSISAAAKEKEISLTVSLDPQLPKDILSDKLKLQEILLNLLSNAVKFTYSKGAVRLIAELIPPEELNEADRFSTTSQHIWMRLMVEDNGIGISKAFLPKIFEPFVQENAYDIKNPNGTGLGLAIVKRYVDMLQGSIHAESVPDYGTTFIVQLPVEIASAPCKTADSLKERNYDLSSLHILLVEDNQLNQEIASILLQEKGATIDIAENGQIAYNKVKDSPPNTYNLILMDIRMPIMNGYVATDCIRKLPHGAKIPILAMTADAYSEDIARCLQVGMNGHIEKPINPEKLYKKISNLSKQK